MSDDWQVGDLALCVRTDGGYLRMPRVNPGQKFIVERVESCTQALTGEPIWGLSFRELRGLPYFYDAPCFRKIRPHVPDVEDAETIRLLNGIKEPAE